MKDNGITVKRGNKHPDDVVVFINDHPITFKEIAKVCIIMCKNEDNIYPPPRYMGGKMLQNFLNECIDRRSVDDDIIQKYKL